MFSALNIYMSHQRLNTPRTIDAYEYWIEEPKLMCDANQTNKRENQTKILCGKTLRPSPLNFPLSLSLSKLSGG